MEVLEKLAARLVGAKGAEYATARKILKTWIDQRPEDTLLKEVETIERVEILRALFAVGLNARLQEAVRLRWIKIGNLNLPLEPTGG